MVDVLAIAVIGGLYRLEGAWLGAFVYVVLNNYLQTIGFIGPRFDTVIGIIFLVIVLVSPAGLMGIWERALGLLRRREPGGGGTSPLEHDTGERRLVRRIVRLNECGGPVSARRRVESCGKQRKGER